MLIGDTAMTEIRNKKTIKKILDEKKADNTKQLYYERLKKYFGIIKIDPDEYFTKRKKEDIEKDLKEFAKEISYLAPISQKMMILTIKKSLEIYDIEFKKKFWEKFKVNGDDGATFKDEIPEKEDLQKIIRYADIRGKALLLLLSSTGMRIGEALNITWDEIDTEKREISIPAEITKTKKPRTVYFTEEAKDSLLDYKENYSDYIKRARGRAKQEIEEISEPKGDKRIFPFKYDIAMEIWHRCLKKAGKPYTDRIPRSNNKYKYHIHTLRKFFKTQLADAGVPEATTEALLGHKDGLNSTYYSPKKAKKFYDENINHLTVFSDMDRAMKKIEPKMKAHESAISILSRENSELKDKISNIEKELTDKIREKVIAEIGNIVKNYTKA